MRGFTVMLITAFLVSISMPEMILAEDKSTESDCSPVEYRSHSSNCDHVCGYVEPTEKAYDRVFCAPGYYCKPGYMREYLNGPCILESECPTVTTVQPE